MAQFDAVRAGMQAVHFDVRAPAASCAQALALLGVDVPAALVSTARRSGPAADEE